MEIILKGQNQGGKDDAGAEDPDRGRREQETLSSPNGIS